MPKSRSRRTASRRPASRRPTPRRQAPAVPPPTAPGLRGAVERRSAPVLTWLSVQPKLLLPLGSLALLMGGFLAPPVLAVPMLLVLLAVMTWLTFLSWPAVQGGGRVVRVATVLLIGLAVVTKLAGG
ncbi:MAG TPA: DUF6703 family protein [Mycobacteriales bacterium]|nr:DUF6703 family protein [Mycobacteriales bacterium]